MHDTCHNQQPYLKFQATNPVCRKGVEAVQDSSGINTLILTGQTNNRNNIIQLVNKVSTLLFSQFGPFSKISSLLPVP